MKKILKIFSYFILTIVLLVITLLVIAKIAENKIADIALKKVSESIEAPVTIDDVSLNLLRKFPLATIELHNVILNEHNFKADSVSFSGADTIANIKKLYVSVKSRPLLKGNIDIVKVDVKGANVNYTVDTSGATNIDFLMVSEEDSTAVDTVPSEPLNLILNDLSAWNITVNYNDESLKTKAKVKLPELKVNVSILGDNILASVVGAVNLSSCSFSETNLYLMNNTNIDFDIDYQNDSVSIKHLKIDTDGAGFSIMGSVVLGDEVKTDVRFIGADLNLAELMKYVPEEILKEYGIDRVKGNVHIDAVAKGVYSDSELPQVDLNINFKDGNIKTKDYPELKNISFSGKATNGILKNNQSSQADFSSLHFETEKSKFDIAFSVLDIDHPKYVINTAMYINVEEFKSFIPDSILKSASGNIKLKMNTKGELPDSIDDSFVDYLMANSQAEVVLNNLNVDVNNDLSIKNFSTKFEYKPNHFSINNLNIDVPVYNFELRNTSLKADFWGSINNMADLRLHVKDYYIETKGAEISGYLKVKNLEKPDYETETKLVFALEETKELLPDSIISDLSGNLIVDINSKAILNLDSIAEQAIDAAFNKSTVRVRMDNITAILPDDPMYKIENLSGLINMSPDALTINKLEGIAAGVSFGIDSTEAWNSYETFVLGSKKEIFTLQTNITVGEINNSLFEAFLPSDTGDEVETKEEIVQKVESEDSLPKFLLPDLSKFGLPHFLIRGKLAIKKLEYENNVVDDISMKFRFADSLYVVDQFKMKTSDGEFNTSLKLDARKWDKPVVDIRSYITKLDLKKLLMLNDNFGDTILTHEKVNGILTSELHLRAFYEDGDWPTDRIRAEGHFTLEDGYIYDYEPLVDLSKSMGSFVAGGLKELDKLDFNTLKTSIFMYKDKVYIPKTDVVTSSMDFSGFAMHSLQDEYEYHLKLHLGDVFTGKSEKLMKEQAKQNKKDGTTVERDGLKLYTLKIDGKKRRGFDTDKLEKEFLKDLNKQKGWLRLFFNPLLVNFSTDLDRKIRNKEIIEKYGGKN